MLGFDALSSHALGEIPPTRGDVPVVHADQAHFAFDGTPYVPSSDFEFGETATEVIADLRVTLELSAEINAEHDSPERDATLAATLDFAPNVEAAHGVAGDARATLDFTADVQASHGVAGTVAAQLDFTAAVQAAHGVTADLGAVLEFAPAIEAVHERYELRGVVRVGGILVNRRVRAYLRSTGALVGEADTVAGKFWIHTGFTPVEHYVVPVHLDEAATDYAPPTRNRVVSVLAQDAA